LHGEYKMSATRDAVIRSSALLGLKVSAFALTGSMALMASMLDSIVDVFASFLAHFVKPAKHSDEHKLALVQSAWIFMGGLVVLYESIKGFNEPVEMASVGVAILVITLIVDASIVRKISKDKNPVVIGLTEDIKADMVNSAGGVIALTLIAMGAPFIADKLIAIVISVFLIAKGARMLHDNMIESTEDHAAEHHGASHEVEGSLEQYV
jgi:divalent metal cation (Fe/Co/Zn/Cd) transporter